MHRLSSRNRRPLAVMAGIATLLATGATAIAQRPPVTDARTPPTIDVVEAPILVLQSAMSEGRTTSRALVEAYLARIAAYDGAGPRLNTIVTLNPNARAQADALDEERRTRGSRGPLHGIPVLVKDNFDTADMPTSAGSLGLATHRPRADAFQVARLRAAGAVILGKTTLHELAYGITTQSSLTGQTRNPYALSRAPGGSSGGTGAAVAASFAAAGMGSDTCGSIRIPSSHNNLVGLRGTRGLSSRTGVVPLSSTQDLAGPLARTVTDLAIMLDATVGADAEDETTAISAGLIPPSYVTALEDASLAGSRIGLLGSLFGAAPEDGEVGAVVRKALDELQSLGAEVVEVTVPGLDELLRESSVINDEFKFDLAAYLARTPGSPIQSVADVLDRGLHHAAIDGVLRRSNAVESRDSDHRRRALIKHAATRAAVLAVLDEHRLDALAYPTIRRKAALIGEAQAGSNCQLSASSGLPALSMPAGFTTDGLPVGVELLGRAFSESSLLRLALAAEQKRQPRRAPFSTPALVGGKAPAPVVFTVGVSRAPNGAAGGPAGVAAARGAGRASASAASTDAATLSVRFTYDVTRASLAFDARTGPTGAATTDHVIAVAIHRTEGDGRPGPVLALLMREGQTEASGSIDLDAGARQDLAAGRLYVQMYTRQRPLGVERLALVVPANAAPAP